MRRALPGGGVQNNNWTVFHPIELRCRSFQLMIIFKSEYFLDSLFHLHTLHNLGNQSYYMNIFPVLWSVYLLCYFRKSLKCSHEIHWMILNIASICRSKPIRRHAVTHLDGDLALWTVASVPVWACKWLCCGCCSTLLFIPRTQNSNKSSSARKGCDHNKDVTLLLGLARPSQVRSYL